jgi:hypothetical protein
MDTFYQNIFINVSCKNINPIYSSEGYKIQPFQIPEFILHAHEINIMNIVSSNKNLPNLKAQEPYALAMLHSRARGGALW